MGAASVIAARCTGVGARRVTELLVTEAALDKLGARAISADETEQLLHNEHLTVATLGREPSQAAGDC